MKIAVLTREFSPKAGGAEHYAMSLVEGLSTTHELHVFAQTIEHHWPGVHYHRISKPFSRPRFLNQWWYAWQTWRHTRRGFDIVHAHENTWHGNVQTVHVLPVWIHYFALQPLKGQGLERWLGSSARAHLLTAKKWLNVALSPRLMSYLWLEHARLSMRGAHRQRHITSVSASLTAQLFRHFKLDPQRVHTLMPAVLGPQTWWHQAKAKVDAQAQNHSPPALLELTRWLEVLSPQLSLQDTCDVLHRPAPDLSSEALMSPALKTRARSALNLPTSVTPDQPITQWLLWVGHDDKKKGLRALLLALSHLPPGVGLMVVGRGALSANARSLAEQYHIAKRVAWLGPMEDVSPAYWACDVLVHPTLEDTFGMVVLEAMSWARAVVVSAPEFCGITSHLSHTQEAWILEDPQDVSELERALSHVLTDSVGNALATRAYLWAQEHTWESVCKSQDAVYQAVLSQVSTPSLKREVGHG